jgi:hypothetical protein
MSNVCWSSAIGDGSETNYLASADLQAFGTDVAEAAIAGVAADHGGADFPRADAHVVAGDV